MKSITAVTRHMWAIISTVLCPTAWGRGRSRGWTLDAAVEAEARTLRPRSRPNIWRRGRIRRHNLKAEVEAEAEHLTPRSKPRPEPWGRGRGQGQV